MRALWLLAVLASCGRIGFDPTAPAGDGGLSGDGGSPADACSFTAFGAPVRIAAVSSPSIDYAPWLSDDRLELIFASDRSGRYQLYRATRATPLDAFGAPQVLSLGAMTADNPYVTSDGLTLWFDGNLTPGRHLITASRPSVGTTFQSPANVPELFGTNTDGGPSLSRDGLTLVFDSNRAGGNHLFQATRSSMAAAFGTPVELAGVISFGTGQGAPAFAVDGSLLFVFFTGTLSQVATAAPGPTGYGSPVTFAPISDGSTNDLDPYMTGDGLAMVFASDRAGATGHDIYMIERSCQ